MAHRKIQKNYEFFSNYDYYIPGPGGMVILLCLLLAGALILCNQCGDADV